jgi:hypothetical protein
MTAQEITVRGGKDAGDVRQINGKWYIRTNSFYMNAVEMEDAYDVNIESGWYSNVKPMETDEDKAFVAAYLAERERKEKEHSSDLYKKNNTALFIPQIGQRVLYRFMKSNPTHGTITELGLQSHMVRVRADGKKSASWIAPFCLALEDGSTDGTFYDLNEAR